MQTSMTFSSIAAMFGAMIVLATVPGVSVLTVSARSAAYGFVHGVFTTVGILIGDVVYILLAIYGFSFLAESNLFLWFKYFGGAYLIWLGMGQLRSKPKAGNKLENTNHKETSLGSSFLAGLFITLADQKAILFYLVFFPAFVDLPTLTLWDTGIIIAIAAIALGGAKLNYTYLAVQAGGLIKSNRENKGINVVASIVMIGVGVFLW